MIRLSIRRLLVLFCVCALLLSGCNENRMYELFESEEEKALDASRPEGATALPDFSGEISDVRVTTVQRDIAITTDHGAENGANLSELTYLQIYYGYCSDGNWTDLPCENYELVSIFNSVDVQSGELKVSRGYEAVEDDHMVKIGPYLLLSVRARIGKNNFYIVDDSIGSEPQLMFMEYDRWNNPDGIASYGYLTEERESILSGGKLNWRVVSNVIPRYYFLLKYDEIPEDYQLWVKKDAASEQIWSLLTYDDIHYLLGDDG